MANTTITNLPTVTSLNGTEPLLGVQSSSSVQITTGQIASYAGATFGLPAIGSPLMLANVTGSSALPTGISVTAFLDSAVTNVQGSIMYRSANLWTALAPGISGQVLSTQGSAANPIWRSTPGTGTVTSITAGTNLSATPANPITSSGTINVIDNPVFATSATSPLFLATASRTATATTGAFSYGTNSFSDVNVLASFQSSVNSYNQATIQNTSAGTSASAEFIAYNDGGTASTNYAAVGINSSGYTGTGSLNAAGYGFFTTGSTDLVLGTIGSNAIHFVTNSAATDAMYIGTTGNVGIGTTSPGVPLDVIGNIKNSSTTGTPVITVQSNQAAGFNPARLQLYRTGAGNTATPDNSTIGEIRFDGLSTGAAYDNIALISVTGGVNAAGGMPSYMIFSTASSGSGATERMRIDSSGNLTFTSTAQRFLADFSNATVNSRFAFQTSTTNGTTGIYALPNGTSTAASWQATNAADPTNASKILIATNGSTDVQLVSGINGTGTYLPLSFYNNGAQKMQLGTNGALAIGANASTTVGLLNSWAITGGTTAYAHLNNGVVQSGVTSQAFGYASQISLAAAAFTTTNAIHFNASPNAGGAGSTISNQFGYLAESTLGTQGAATITNAYGFYGNLASGTNKWNLYMAGTAANFLNGFTTLNAGVTSTLGFYENAATISTNYTIGSSNNAVSTGPLSITATVTVPTGSSWTIV